MRGHLKVTSTLDICSISKKLWPNFFLWIPFVVLVSCYFKVFDFVFYLWCFLLLGFSAFKKVDILWRELPSTSKSSRGSTGELYLQVFMSESCDRNNFWNALVDSCLHIMDLIDWEWSHPDNVHDLTVAYGVDVAWKYFLRVSSGYEIPVFSSKFSTAFFLLIYNATTFSLLWC